MAQEQAGIVLGLEHLRARHRLAERNCWKNPWISQARVTRDLPRSLRIEIKEREPAALAVFSEQLYLVTAEGRAVQGATSPAIRPTFPSSPASRSRVCRATSARELDRRARRAFAVLEQYSRVPLSKTQPAQEVHLARFGRRGAHGRKRGHHLRAGP